MKFWNSVHSKRDRGLHHVFEQPVGVGIAVARATLAKVPVGLDRAGIDRVLVPLLPPGEVAVRLTRKSAKAFGEAQLIATDKGVNPVGGEVVVAMLGIEQPEDQRIAIRQDERAIIGVGAGVGELGFVCPGGAGGIFLSALLWVGYQYVVPKANLKWANFEAKYIDGPRAPEGNTTNYKQKLYFKTDSFTYVGIRGYDTVLKSGNGFFVQQFQKNKLVYNLRAEQFNWDSTKNKWKLLNAVERRLDSISERVTRTPEMFMSYNFKPRDLRKDEFLKDQLPTPELDEFIKLERLRGSESLNMLLVERYNRDAIPVSVLILTIIGVVLASRKVRGGSGLHLAIGVVISVLYILFSRFSLVFATKGNFTPFIAAWTPNIVFGLLAFYLYKKAPK